MNWALIARRCKGVKHEVVEVRDGLVHIKCCQTGKYWTLAGADGNFIAAEADQPVEGGTSAACMLIKPSFKDIGSVTVVNFHFQRQSKWHSLFVNNEGHLQSGENIAEDFIISDWEKFSCARQTRSTGGGIIKTEEVAIEGGASIAGMETRGPGPGSIFSTTLGGRSSAGDGTVSVADVNIKAGDMPVGGTVMFGKRTLKGSLNIGFPAP
ncbi:hypothetical protein RHSIM_Rhsim05G0057900 [Rhododendron simsii]|uniref:Agglutinin domain-containing protein n=1 Tax=Rhododendron simsii TaxID=118357 RepID=A0A834GY09_RHOSS|nr:hypothetical protein RHSIM_Rhsim05G0057900 [Rhododendron simsii]